MVSNIDPSLFADFRAKTAPKARGKLAPMAIIDCIEAACTMPIAEGLAYETVRIQQLSADPQHAALKHVFFAERQAQHAVGQAQALEALLSVAREQLVLGVAVFSGGDPNQLNLVELVLADEPFGVSAVCARLGAETWRAGR